MTNLIESVRRNLQYPELQKMVPGAQEVSKGHDEGGIDQLGQAAIPAVITGLYKLSRNDEGCLSIMNAAESSDSLAVLFKGHEEEVVEKIAGYAGVSPNQAESHLENIADESIRLVKEASKGSPVTLKHLMNDQRDDILVYLPATLNLTDMLDAGDPGDTTENKNPAGE